jgi:hypothetical protein
LPGVGPTAAREEEDVNRPAPGHDTECIFKRPGIGVKTGGGEKAERRDAEG